MRSLASAVVCVVALLAMAGCGPKEFTPLQDAAREGDLARARKLIAKGADVNAIGPGGATALGCAIHYAYAHRRPDYRYRLQKQGCKPAEMVDILLSHGADVNPRRIEGGTYLHGAIELEDSTIAQLLLAHSADVHAKDSEGRTPLHIAAMFDRIRTAQGLLRAGADVDAVDSAGQTPLHNASTIPMARLLLDAGADIDAKDNTGSTPLHVLIDQAPPETQSDLDLVRFLLGRGTDINAKMGEGDTPLLHSLGMNCTMAITALLICRGADVNIRNDDGDSAIVRARRMHYSRLARVMRSRSRTNRQMVYMAAMKACLSTHNTEEISLLLANGGSPRTQDADGYTMLHFAADHGSTDIMKLLIRAGADVNARNNLGQTPLFNCIVYPVPYTEDPEKNMISVAPFEIYGAKPHKSPIRVLNEAGADINARDKKGLTPLHVAVQIADSPGPALELISLGADVNAAAEDGMTPLHYAARNPYADRAVWSLVRHGARVNARIMPARRRLL